MYIDNWKIFDKHGSPLNWSPDPFLPLSFSSATGKGATGYLITDTSGYINGLEVTNSGFDYTDPTEVYYEFTFGNGTVEISNDVSISYVDVSIFDPDGRTTTGIGDVSIGDVSGNFLYPATTFSSAIFLKPVSQGLVETEHLYILEEFLSGLGRPYDASNPELYVQMVGEDDEIKLFTVDEDLADITWTNSVTFDLSERAPSTPLTLNIGFRSDDEGVYERRLRFYHIIDGKYYLLGEILVNAESIGEDERFRTLLGNFGLPDPKDFPRLFKEADINEALPDYEIVNPKSKQMILEHDEIIPYIGTYKALINAIKWLGYEDIYVREWFKNVKENKKLSLIVPYNAKDRTQTILKFSPDERKVLKKLNQLSLNYCITRETGEIDEWGTPETENCYEYSIEEVFIKLVALKKWLEKNIIGVNARIIDITGEGIYFERYINLVWSTDNVGYDYREEQSLTPKTVPDFSELSQGESSINMTLLEFEQSRIGDNEYRFYDYINYVWNPNDPSVTLSPDDPSYLADPSSYLEVGPPLGFPFVSIKDIQWKALVEKPFSGTVPEGYVTNPLWVYDNTIKFYNVFDSSTIFYDSSVNLRVIMEEGYIRDASNNDWENSIEYSIYPNDYIRLDSSVRKLLTYYGMYTVEDGSGILYTDTSTLAYNDSVNPISFLVEVSTYVDTDTSTKILSPQQEGYMIESSTGELYEYADYFWLAPDTSGLLQYADDELYRVPLLSFKNYYTYDENELDIPLVTDKLYHLDILDGKISMDVSTNPDLRLYINFNYDTSLSEQNIQLNAEYISPRMPLYVVDPSRYYWADPSGLSGGDSSLAIDNSIYTMPVHHSGEYTVEAYAWDGYNTLYSNTARNNHDVLLASPGIYTISNNRIKGDPSILLTDVSTIISENNIPVFQRELPYLGLEFDEDSSGYFIKAPSITYFQNLPDKGSIDKFYLASEKIKNITGSIIEVDKLYEDFLTGDDVVLIKTYIGSYMMVDEASAYVTSGYGVGNSLILDNPPIFSLDGSHNIFIHNVTERETSNLSNNPLDITFSLDVSDYTFLENQLVNLIVKDGCTGGEWGSSYRVIDVSGNNHTFNMTFPQFIIDGSSRYDVKARHSYASFANYELDVSLAIEKNGAFQIYHNNDYREHFIDNTFVMLNILFDQEHTNDYWYDSSSELDSSIYYIHENTTTVNIGQLVILNTIYDPSTYLLNQKNIWTIQENSSKDIVFRVFNERVPFTFDASGYYDVTVESYDIYGNLAYRNYPGLIHVV